MMNDLGILQIHKGSQTGQNRVTAAIQQASAETGVDFNYLMKQAAVESSMNPNAKAKTSSATGLYQFIEQTWLRMVKNHGAEHGLEKYADAITQRSNGDYTVSNRAVKNNILNLRKDPKAASIMAAELASDNHDVLKQTVKRDITGTDLYLAHFLGAQGASNFLNSMKKNPWAPASSLFPEAAASNRGVFFENGRPRTLSQVYANFEAKFEGTGTPVTQTADNSYARRVVLPLADDWSNPGFAATTAATISESVSNANAAVLQAAAQKAVTRTNSGLMAFAPQAASEARRIGGFLSSPVDVMMIAQNDMPIRAHEDSNRYNS